MKRLMGVWLLVCAGCAGGAHSPPGASLETLRRTYPPEQYLVGVGEGETMELARRRAAVEISSQIGGSLRAEGWVEAESGRTEQGEIDREQIRESIRVETDLARMEWVEVVSARTRGGTVEVVAVLDRRKAAQRLRAEIDERVEGIRVGLERALQNTGLLARAKALLLLERERNSLQTSLRLLSAVSPGPAWRPPALRELDKAQGEVHARLREVEWEICLESEGGTALASIFAGRLGERGVLARECGAPPSERERFRLQGRLAASVQKLEHPGGYPYFCSTQLSYRIVGAEEAMEAGGTVEGLRSGARAAPDACALSLQALAGDFLERIGWASRSAQADL